MKKFLFYFILFYFIFIPVASFAGEIFLENKKKVLEDEVFLIDVRLKTDKVSINSADMLISFDASKLDFVGFEQNKSVINFWIIPPKIEDGNKIRFTGIIPGGVSETYEAGKVSFYEVSLVNLRFKAKISGSTNFDILESVVLKNDGLGSNFSHIRKNSSVNILKNENILDQDEDKDVVKKIISSNLEVIFIESSFLDRTPNLIVFNTLDSFNGIKEYQIKRGREDWQIAQNPEPVSRGLFNKNFLVRAYDYEGNYQEASVLVPGALPINYLLIILGVFLALFLTYKLIK